MPTFGAATPSAATGSSGWCSMSAGSARIRERWGWRGSTAFFGTWIEPSCSTRDRVATGATYIRHRGGPWAKPLESVLRDLERRGLVAQRPRVGDREPDLLVSLARPDLAGFDAEEISLVEAMTRALCFDQRSTIPLRDAHDTILAAARLGEVIPYFTVFSGRPAETSAADLAWAIRESERRKGNKAAPPAEAPTGRLRAAVDGLLWHLLRDPSLGASLPAGGAGSWFVYRQHGMKHAGVPDLACVYRLEADELVLGGIRVARATTRTRTGKRTSRLGSKPSQTTGMNILG